MNNETNIKKKEHYVVAFICLGLFLIAIGAVVTLAILNKFELSIIISLVLALSITFASSVLLQYKKSFFLR